MSLDEKKRFAIEEALEKVFRIYNQKAGPRHQDRRTRDFVFHMTDWYEDLAQLWELFSHPAAHTQEDWNRCVHSGILNHAMGHILAAAKLNGPLWDPFEAASQPTAKAPTRREYEQWLSRRDRELERWSTQCREQLQRKASAKRKRAAAR